MCKMLWCPDVRMQKRWPTLPSTLGAWIKSRRVLSKPMPRKSLSGIPKGSWDGQLFGYALQIRSLCKNGGLDEALKVVDCMEKQGLSISRDIIYSLLQGCIEKKDLAYARKVQGLMRKHGLSSIAALGDHLIRLFTTCRSLYEANAAFLDVSKPTVFTWNSLISAHAKLGKGIKALQLYEKMQQDGTVPDRVTFVCICNACGCVEALISGMLIHHQVVRDAHEVNTIMGNSLIDMYAKCGCLDEARKLFEIHAERDMVTWIVMISGYAAQGHGLAALEMYIRMHYDGIKPNNVVMLCAIKACACIGALNPGQLIHNKIIEDALESNKVLMSSLVDMYAKCGCLEDAGKVFNELPACDVVAWSVMIDGYAQSEHAPAALEVFKRMLHVGVEPNEATFLSVLKACGATGAVSAGRVVHMYITRKNVEICVIIGTAMMDMYFKCKCLEDAHSAFMGLSSRNLVSWGTVISGFSEAGHASTALKLFNEMILEEIEPNTVIFSCVLKACSSIEALEEGMLIHVHISQMGFESDQIIGNTLVHLYAKNGDLAAARVVFNQLLIPNVVSFGALIAGYSHQGCGALALDLYDEMQKRGIFPERATFLVLLKACSSVGAVGYGKLIHEQVIKYGLDSVLLVRNALANMYVKTGKIDEACQVLSHTSIYDVVACNSMIGGFALQGDSEALMQILEDMRHVGVEPDSAMLASIFAACSSAGLSNEGWAFFASIQESGETISTTEQCSSLIDLLARSGQLHVAKDMSVTMPMPPDSITCTSLLTNCKTHSNMEQGREFFGQAMDLDTPDSFESHINTECCGMEAPNS